MRPRVSSRFLEGLLYALTVFGPFAFGCVEPWSRAALEILAFALALACFLRGRSAAASRGEWLWLFAAAFAVLGVVQLGTFAPADGPRPWGPFTAAPHATEAAVLLWAAYAAILWSVPRVVVTHEAARRFARFLFGLGLTLAAFGLLQAGSSPDRLYWLREAPRAGFGPYYNRDHAANALLMTMLVGVGLFFSRARRGAAVDGTPRRHRAMQALIAGGVLLLFGGIVVCGSRGAFLALPFTAAAALLPVAYYEKDRGRRRALAVAALAGGVFVGFMAYRHVVAGADAGALVDKSISGRLSIYGDAARWWRDSPSFGTGLGSFESVYPSYQDLDLRATVAHAHDDWLELALETGLAGLLAALTAAALAAFFTIRAWREARSDEMRALIAGAAAAAAAFALHSLFDFSFQIPGNAVVFMSVVGFLLSAPAWADKTAAPARPRTPSRTGALAAAALFLVLAQDAIRPAVAAWLASAAGDSRTRADGLTRAYAWDRDPALIERSVWIDYEAGASPSAGPAGVRALRAAVVRSLAVIDESPFDSDALFFAGASLWRLGRVADGRALIDDSHRVRFRDWIAPKPGVGFSYDSVRRAMERKR